MVAALVMLVAVQHLGFLILEMFFWQKPLGRRVFRMSKEKAEASAALAANQGLYNGFLAGGLIWSLLHPEPMFAYQLQIYFLICVLIAAVFGSATVSWRILLVQGAPAAIALMASTL